MSSSPCIKSVDERGHMHSKWVTEDEPKSSPSTFDESNAKPESDPFSASIENPKPDCKERCLLMS